MSYRFRDVHRGLGIVLLLLLSQFGFIAVAPVYAACPTFPTTVPASDSVRLIEVIGCANATVANDVINLTNSTYTLTTSSGVSTGLPPIVSAQTGGTLTINGNNATITRDGAGAFRLIRLNNGANLTLNQVSLTNGSVGGSSGGAIFNDGGVLVVRNSTINLNTAGSGGGIYNAGGGTTTLNGSTVSNNVATINGGGAVVNNNATLNVVNSTISGNSANGFGGGAVNSFGFSAVMRFYSSTVTNNTAIAPNIARSGIWQESGSAEIVNSIVAHNNGANNCAFDGGTSSNANSIDNGTSCSFDGLYGQNTNPLLGALASNGGITPTHALLPGSPAINNGDNSEVNAIVTLLTDQRGVGFPRINNGTVDIGAYETELSSLSVNLVLEGRSNPAPHPSYTTSVRVRIMPLGGGAAFYNQVLNTNTSASFTIPDVPVGGYLFEFKGAHTLARQTVKLIVAGANSLTTNTLLEGDADGNNLINVSDFSLLATAFGKTTAQQGYNALTDFNQDGIVNVSDFSLLATNFNKTGDGGVTP